MNTSHHKPQTCFTHTSCVRTCLSPKQTKMLILRKLLQNSVWLNQPKFNQINEMPQPARSQGLLNMQKQMLTTHTILHNHSCQFCWILNVHATQSFLSVLLDTHCPPHQALAHHTDHPCLRIMFQMCYSPSRFAQ